MNREVIGKILVLAVFLTTFWFSSKPVGVSRDQSNGILIRLKIIDQEDIADKTPIYRFWGRNIRKLAHFGFFAIAGIGGFLITGSIKKSIAIVCLMGSVDELHQIFVPGRGAEVEDIMRDTFGGAIGAAFIMMADSLQTAYKRSAKLIYK